MVFYMRSGGEARLYYRYLKEEKRAVEVIGELDLDKDNQPRAKSDR